MRNGDGTIQIVFNDEIYNYKELAKRTSNARPFLPNRWRYGGSSAPL